MQLVSPRLVADTEARKMKWGGAAACEDCKFKRRQEFGDGLPEDYCIENTASGKCLFPAPATLPSLAGLWHVWAESRHSIRYAGMDSAPTGRDFSEVELLCRANAEPFDSVFVERFNVLQDAWLKQVDKKRAAAEQQKKKREV